jgi:hypothetical protein
VSLTSLLLHNNQIKGLFATIPNMKELFTSEDGGAAFPLKPDIIVPRQNRATPIIGHIYDYWLRAYVQRINRNHQEKNGEHLAALVAVHILGSQKIHNVYEEIVKRRNAYILGESDLTKELIRDLVILGQLEHFYRSGSGNAHTIMHVSNEDMEDLINLARATETRSKHFISKDNIICNPLFGEAITQLVGGADADIIIDNTLVDIKCESIFKWRIGHLRQLIGYWILSCLTPGFTPEIKHLAIWNPRYCRLVSISVEDIRRSVNMIDFTDRFIEILSSDDFDGNDHLQPTVKAQYIDQVKSNWHSNDQPILSFYK